VAAPPRAPAARPRRAQDAGLIQRSLGGDHAAARDLHRHYYPVVTSFLRKLGTRPGEIEDATQEVFIRFFRYLGSFRGEAELKTWIFRLCVTEARRARRRRRIAAALAAVLGREPPDEPVAPAVKSEATVHELARRALDRMDPEQRLAFVLFEIEGMTGRQVAAIAGKSMASTYRRLYEAQRLFRETLGIDTGLAGGEEARRATKRPEEQTSQ
jgi:RNA polymerase sigma-70 factor (ECF subfamily)